MNVRFFFHRHWVGAVIFGVLFLSLNSKLAFDQQKVFKSTQYQLSPAFFKFVTGGFWPPAVDFMWIQTIQTMSLSHYTNEAFEPAKSFYRLATDLDPHFYEMYEQSAVLFSFFFGRPEAGIEMLEKGIKHYESGTAYPMFWTHPYSLYILAASTYAFELNDWSRAKQFFLRAGAVPNSPEYLKRVESWLAKEGSEDELARRVLKQLIQNTDDVMMKEKYKEKLKKYES